MPRFGELSAGEAISAFAHQHRLRFGPRPMSSIAKNIAYADGYIALNLFEEARAELDAVDERAHHEPDYMAARLRLHRAEHRWDLVVRFARVLTMFKPALCEAWLAWATALRAQGRIDEARAVLEDAETLHGRTSALLHYKLACCCALLRDLPMAKLHLAAAQALDDTVAEDARMEPDLEPLWTDPC